MPIGLGDLVELVERLAGGVEVAGGDRDVDEHREQRRPGQPVRPRVLQAAADDRHRGVDAALRQAQQGEPAARSAAQLLGSGERLLGPVELAQPAADVADLGVGRRAVDQVAADQLLAGPRRLPLRLGQRPPPLEHDGPVHPADAREDGERVLLRPAHRGLGPLGGPVEVAELLAGADEAAVHLAGRVRAEPALDGEQHRLVEVAHALGDVALVDQHAALGLEGLGLEVGRPQRAAELDHLRRRAPAARSRSPAPCAVSASRSSSAPCSTHSGSVVERSPGPPQPPAGDRRPGHEAVVLVQPHRALPGPALVAELVVGPVGELAGRDAVVEAPEPPRGLGQQVGPLGLVRRRVERRPRRRRRRPPASRGGQRGADRRQLSGPGPLAPRRAALHGRT